MGKYIFLLCSIILVHGCGGGGGNSSSPPGQRQPTKVVLKLATQGSLPPATAIAGLGITVNLPAGVTVATDANGDVASGVVIVSGNTAATSVAFFSPATASAPAALSLVLASTDVAGFGVGEFATINCQITAGSNPKATDISTSDFRAVDLNGSTIPGLSSTFTADIQ